MSIKETRIENIPIERIYIGKGAVRTRQIETDLDGLMKNIRRFGLLYPLIVYQVLVKEGLVKLSWSFRVDVVLLGF